MDWMGLPTGPAPGRSGLDGVGVGGVGLEADAPLAATIGLTLGEAPMEAGHGNVFGTMPPIFKVSYIE